MPSNTTRTPKARALGTALRDARKAQDVSLRALATRLGKDFGTLSRWENGERIPKATDVAQILTMLGIQGERYDEIIEMVDGTDQRRWLAITMPEQRQQLNALLDFERTAQTITAVSPLLIPGLLQIPEYVRAIMTAPGVPPDEVETRITIRRGRHDAITGRNPARFVTLIGVAALRQIVGSASVMAEQLRYLLQAAEWPNVDLRVLPFNTGWHPALEGMFILIDSQETVPVVHLETRASLLFLHDRADIEAYRQAIDTLHGVALSPADSATLVAEMITHMETATR